MKYVRRPDKFVFGIGVILAGFLFVLILQDVFLFGVDDSFIFFRYAENLSNGNGFVFNPGEAPGEGFTSWVWLILLAFFHYIGLGIILMSKILGILFHLLGGILIFLVVIKLIGSDNISKVTACIISGCFLLNYRLIAHSVSGMETSLYIFSIILLTYLTTLALKAQLSDNAEKWWLYISIATTGIFLVRPEGIVAGGISLLILAYQKKQHLLKPKVWFYLFAGLVIPIALFITWKIIVFGYFLPLSYYHKFIVIKAEYGKAFQHFLLFLKNYWWLIVLALSIICYSLLKRKKKFLLFYYSFLFFFMVTIYLFFYPTMNYLHRFYIPYLPLLLLITSPIGYYIIKKINHLKNNILRVFSLLLLFSAAVWGINLDLDTSKMKIKAWSKLVNPGIYRARLGKIMGFLPPSVVVANTEMGVIPYYSGLTCIDMAGLTDPYISHNGLSMVYLKNRKTDIVLFPRDVTKISIQDWNNYTLNYKAIFLSERFKRNFKFICSFGAWGNSKKKYYIYADKTSPLFADIQKWREKYTAEFVTIE